MTAPALDALTKTKPGGLLDQYKLLCAIIDAPWSTALDHRVARHVIDRYMARYGQARASSRYLAEATGARRQNVIDSLRRLTDGGAFVVSRQGIGTRPTEYAPNFSFAVSGPAEESTNGDFASGPVEGTTSGPAEESTRPSSGPVEGTESYLREPADKPGLRVSSTRPSSPPVAAADAAPTAAGRDPFEQLWQPYPKKAQRPKAKAAFNRLAPDVDLLKILIERATALAERSSEIGLDKRWIPDLANWLDGQRWTEDLPEARAERPRLERAPKAAKRQAAHSTQAANIKGGVTNLPKGDHLLEIVAVEHLGAMTIKEIIALTLHDTDGREFKHELRESEDDEEHMAFVASYRSLAQAVTGDGLGQRVHVSVKDVATYRAAL